MYHKGLYGAGLALLQDTQVIKLLTSDAAPINEMIDVSFEDMKFAMGRNWANQFKIPKNISKGFAIGKFAPSTYISAKEKIAGAPNESNIVFRGTVADGIINLVKKSPSQHTIMVAMMCLLIFQDRQGMVAVSNNQ